MGLHVAAETIAKADEVFKGEAGIDVGLRSQLELGLAELPHQALAGGNPLQGDGQVKQFVGKGAINGAVVRVDDAATKAGDGVGAEDTSLLQGPKFKIGLLIPVPVSLVLVKWPLALF
jgi:hypothetical protein